MTVTKAIEAAAPLPLELVSNPLPNLISAGELAEQLKWDVRRVYRQSEQGKLPYYGAPGERKQYCLAEVLETLHHPAVVVGATIRPLGVVNSSGRHLKVEAMRASA